MLYPKNLNNLIESFKKLPGVGEKTAERLAFSIMKFDEDDADVFSESIKEVNKKTKKCELCNHITEKNICDVCEDKTRDKKTICIVEDSKNVFMMEKLGIYKGLYFVLGNLISPLQGINVEDMKLDFLIERINKEKIEEVIIVLKPNIEGETTALYISKLLEGKDIKISKIAQGIPVGADMEYIDSLTMERAFEKRTEI